MNEEETRAFMQSAPTTLPQKRASPLPWDDELLLAAAEGDIPRMARALEELASLEAHGALGAFVTQRYAKGRLKRPDAEDNLRLHFTAHHVTQVWAWFKAQGMRIQAAWGTLYDNDAPLAHPIDAACAEVNLWALWGNLSQKERSCLLTRIDMKFSLEEHTLSAAPVSTLEGLPPFTSTLMKEVASVEGINRSVCGEALPPLQLQDRVLALSSLFRARAGLCLNPPDTGYSEDYMLLGLWAYAPPSVLYDLTQIPSYPSTLTACLTRLVSTYHTLGGTPQQSFSAEHPPWTVLVARRLARGTRTLLQNGFAFSEEDLKALLTVEEVRPLLEERFLKEALEEKDATPTSKASPRSQPRL